jgi:hypothetical protein
MTTIVTRTVSRLLLCGGLFVTGGLFSAGVARAGGADNMPVTFYTSGGLQGAKGVMRAVRATPDSTQWIGCTRYSYASGSNYVLCQARDANGVMRTCTSTLPAMEEAAEFLGSAAYLDFRIASDGTNCHRLGVTVDSTCL